MLKAKILSKFLIYAGFTWKAIQTIVILQTLTYFKRKNTSGLRLIMHITLRGHPNDPDRCQLWQFRFDGNRCTNPGSIEQVDYSANTGNYHRAADSELIG